MIRELSSLRFIFFTFIFLHHVQRFEGGGSLSVAFFFVLSGFCMSLGYLHQIFSPDFSYKSYITRRAIKCYPLHWICLLIFLFLIHFEIHGWKVLSLNATLLQSWIPKKSVYFSYNAGSWYLSDEIFMYAIFPWLARAINIAGKQKRIFILSSITILYILLVTLVPNEHRHAILYINPLVRCIDFTVGIFLALCFIKLKDNLKFDWTSPKSRTVTSGLIAANIGFLVWVAFKLSEPGHLIAVHYWPGIACLILVCALSGIHMGGCGFLRNKILVFLGNHSFTFYMVHLLILRFWEVNLEFGSRKIFIFTAFIATICFSIILDTILVKPISKWLTKRILPSSTAS